MKESKFQIIASPSIIESRFRLNRDYVGSGDISIQLENRIEIVEVNKETNESTIRLEIGIFNDRKIEQVPFKILVVAEGFFTWSDDLNQDEDLLEKLLNQNAPAVLYGYIRQEIRMMTINANIPILDIPLMDFTR